MLTATKEFSFCAAHYLPGHECCGVLHGHNYQVFVTFEACDDEDDMVVDFGKMKQHIKPIIDELDHRYLNDVLSYPSAENIARYLFDRIQEKVAYHTDFLKAELVDVLIYESLTSYVRYSL